MVDEFILHHYKASWGSLWIGECFLCGEGVVFREIKEDAERELNNHINEVHYAVEETLFS